MIDFVWTTPFLIIKLWVAMATMHFHIAQTCFLGIVLHSGGGPREQFGTNENLSLYSFVVYLYVNGSESINYLGWGRES